MLVTVKGEGVGGGILGTFGEGVWLGSLNPEPISDQNMSFSGTFFRSAL